MDRKNALTGHKCKKKVLYNGYGTSSLGMLSVIG